MVHVVRMSCQRGKYESSDEVIQLTAYSYHVTRTLPFACPTAIKFSGSDFGYHATHYIQKYMSSVTKELLAG